MFKKVANLVKDHKKTLIKVGSAALGAVVGVLGSILLYKMGDDEEIELVSKVTEE